MTVGPEPGDVVAELVEAAAGLMPASLAGRRIVGIGWGTVDLERAAATLGASLGLPVDAWTSADRDHLLGATALLGPPLSSSVSPAPGPDSRGPRLVLLEPDTEGRLAASLARHGEGVAAVYVVATLVEGAAPSSVAAVGSPGAPVRSSIAPGPLGRARLVLGGPIWGPHVIVLEAPANPESLPSADD